MSTPSRGLIVAGLLAACGSEPSIPADLEAVEASAEAAFDAALTSDFVTARTEADAAASAWATYRRRAEADQAPASAIAAIDSAVAALPGELAGTPNAVNAARAVNTVSAPMSTFYALYSPVVPVAVLDLDYLGREVLLDALASDFTGATGHLDQIESSWNALKPKVIGAGGTAESADFDAVVAGSRAAIAASSTTDLEASARTELDVVDAIESVFATADAPD